MRIHVLAVITVVLALAIAALAAGNPFAGTWKLNPAKSTFAPGQNLQSKIITNEARNDGIKQVFEGIGSDGEAFRLEYFGKYNGMDYPITGNPNADTVAYRKLKSNTLEIVEKKDGEVISKGKWVISKDGKTAIVTSRKGNEVISTELWERQ